MQVQTNQTFENNSPTFEYQNNWTEHDNTYYNQQEFYNDDSVGAESSHPFDLLLLDAQHYQATGNFFEAYQLLNHASQFTRSPSDMVTLVFRLAALDFYSFQVDAAFSRLIHFREHFLNMYPLWTGRFDQAYHKFEVIVAYTDVV